MVQTQEVHINYFSRKTQETQLVGCYLQIKLKSAFSHDDLLMCTQSKGNIFYTVTVNVCL